MSALEIIAIITACLELAQRGATLLAGLQEGSIKPDDIDPESLKAPDVEAIIAKVRAGQAA